MSENNDRLIECFSSVFPDLSKEEITMASMASVAEWDSLATITLLTVMEEAFGIEYGPADLEYLVSFELILDFLENKTG